jgi:hypothetical protein
MSRATPEATRRWHPATTCSILPQQPPGQQANKQQSTNTPTKLAIPMAMAMRRYVTAPIAQWRRSKALLEATGRCHQASIMSNNIKRTWLRCFFLMFFIVNTIGKGHELTLTWLGIPIFGSNFWDPHRKQNSDFVFDSKDSGWIFF